MQHRDPQESQDPQTLAASSNSESANGQSDGANPDAQESKTQMVEALELPLQVLPDVHPCQGCAGCCKYIATEIDSPTSMQDYEHIVWYIAHRDVAVYIDWEGDWFLEFTTVCDHLTEAQTCGIYRERPRICSDFSWNECEKTTQEPAYREHFAEPKQFVSWLEENRPKASAKYEKFRRKLIEKREAASIATTGAKGAGLSGQEESAGA